MVQHRRALTWLWPDRGSTPLAVAISACAQDVIADARDGAFRRMRRICQTGETASAELGPIRSFVETNERDAFAGQERSLDQFAVLCERVDGFGLGHRWQTLAEAALAV